MALARNTLLAPLVRWASRRRFPVLLGLALALLAVDLAVPDAIPLVDEALLALTALLLARLRKPARKAAVPADAEREPAA